MSPQCERLLEYLKDGYVVTNLNSWKNLGIYATSQRIGDLINNHGVPVHKGWMNVKNKYGEPCRIRAYWLPIHKTDTRH